MSPTKASSAAVAGGEDKVDAPPEEDLVDYEEEEEEEAAEQEAEEEAGRPSKKARGDSQRAPDGDGGATKVKVLRFRVGVGGAGAGAAAGGAGHGRAGASQVGHGQDGGVCAGGAAATGAGADRGRSERGGVGAYSRVGVSDSARVCAFQQVHARCALCGVLRRRADQAAAAAIGDGGTARGGGHARPSGGFDGDAKGARSEQSEVFRDRRVRQGAGQAGDDVQRDHADGDARRGPQVSAQPARDLHRRREQADAARSAAVLGDLRAVSAARQVPEPDVAREQLPLHHHPLGHATGGAYQAVSRIQGFRSAHSGQHRSVRARRGRGARERGDQLRHARQQRSVPASRRPSGPFRHQRSGHQFCGHRRRSRGARGGAESLRGAHRRAARQHRPVVVHDRLSSRGRRTEDRMYVDAIKSVRLRVMRAFRSSVCARRDADRAHARARENVTPMRGNSVTPRGCRPGGFDCPRTPTQPYAWSVRSIDSHRSVVEGGGGGRDRAHHPNHLLPDDADGADADGTGRVRGVGVAGVVGDSRRPNVVCGGAAVRRGTGGPLRADAVRVGRRRGVDGVGGAVHAHAEYDGVFGAAGAECGRHGLRRCASVRGAVVSLLSGAPRGRAGHGAGGLFAGGRHRAAATGRHGHALVVAGRCPSGGTRMRTEDMLGEDIAATTTTTTDVGGGGAERRGRGAPEEKGVKTRTVSTDGDLPTAASTDRNGAMLTSAADADRRPAPDTATLATAPLVSPFRTMTFALLAPSYFLLQYAFGSFSEHFLIWLSVDGGIRLHAASVYLSVLYFCAFAAKLVGGYLGDRFNRARIAAVAAALAALGASLLFVPLTWLFVAVRFRLRLGVQLQLRAGAAAAGHLPARPGAVGAVRCGIVRQRGGRAADRLAAHAPLQLRERFCGGRRGGGDQLFFRVRVGAMVSSAVRLAARTAAHAGVVGVGAGRVAAVATAFGVGVLRRAGTGER
eukprot:ctg_1721.g406